MCIRIAFHGYRGGVGKTILSLMLAKALAEKGFSVLFIDRDILSYASFLGKIKGEGLLVQIGEGKEPRDFYTDIKVGKGVLRILKMFSPGMEYYKLLNEFDKGEEFKQFYTNFLKNTNPDYIIVDNPVFLIWEHNPIKYEALAFKEVYPNVKSKVVLVSDFLKLSITSSINYLKIIGTDSPLDWEPYAVIINMVIGDKRYYVKDLNTIRNAFGFKKGVIVQFYDSIFQYSGRIEDLPVVREIDELLNNDKEEIIL